MNFRAEIKILKVLDIFGSKNLFFKKVNFFMEFRDFFLFQKLFTLLMSHLSYLRKKIPKKLALAKKKLIKIMLKKLKKKCP